MNAQVEGVSDVGLIAGITIDAKVRNSYARGSIVGRNARGIVDGAIAMGIPESVAINTMTDGAANVGGLLGHAKNTTIENVYAQVDIIGEDMTRAGGLIGYLYLGSTVTNAYTLSSISNIPSTIRNPRVNLTVGNAGGTVRNTYYDMTTPCAGCDSSSPEGESLSPNQLTSKMPAVFKGFDFNNEWTFGADELPQLAWEHE